MALLLAGPAAQGCTAAAAQRRLAAPASSSSSSLAPGAARWQRPAAAAPARQQQPLQRRPGRLAVAATAAADAAAEPQAGGFKPDKPTLFGVPVSNCAARVRRRRCVPMVVSLPQHAAGMLAADCPESCAYDAPRCTVEHQPVARSSTAAAFSLRCSRDLQTRAAGQPVGIANKLPHRPDDPPPCTSLHVTLQIQFVIFTRRGCSPVLYCILFYKPLIRFPAFCWPPCPLPALQNRFVIYKKGLEGEVDVQPPKLLGEKGVKSPAYLALNPQVG